MLKIDNLTKIYKAGDMNVTALKNVSIQFRKNEFVCILGPSGCGKTTLLNIIGGLDRYTKGDIQINGVSTKHYKDRDWDTYRNHSIGFVFQSYNLIPHLSVAENVEMALTIGGVKKDKRRQLAIKALKEVGLNGQQNKRPNQLSGGQMQRVAIARALVNNPDIILADEPTGALDSVTSVQIMKLLQKVAQKRLVIMVTHNNDLATEYATRIVSLFDGEKINDTNPYEENDEKADKKTQSKDVKKEQTENVEVKPITKKKAKMSFFTAIYLSFKNLLTKKGRTFMTAFAGSIGIIGIALVLAINNGFTVYMNNLQSNALSGLPLTVTAISMDYDAFSNINRQEGEQQTDEDKATVYDPAQMFMQFGHYNYLGNDFIEYVKQFENTDNEKNEEQKQLNALKYNYFTPLKVISKSATNNYKYYQSKNQTSIMSGSTNDTFYEGFDKDFVTSQYDVIYGTYPEKKANDDATFEVALVVDEGNKVDYKILNTLGLPQIPNIETREYDDVTFQAICDAQIKLIFNDEYYVVDNTNFDEITSFSKIDTTSQEVLAQTYQNENAITLKISGVLRIKEDAESEILSSGIMFTPDLGEYYRNNCKQSVIGRKQIENKESGNFYDNFVVIVSEMPGLLGSGYPSVAGINNYLNYSYGFTLENDEAFELGVQQIGISDMPTSIMFYVNNFDAKEAVLKLISDFNETDAGKAHSIVVADSSSMLTSTLGQMVNIISYVLIAFAAISLVVSSIMIGIISYVSVIERTKEIGVLRSLGARKIDISNVFNAETFIVGTTSGILGVGITLLLTIPINLIINSVAGGAVSNIASLNPLHAVILVGLSMLLTLIAGLIPARIASKKDPVIALRTE